MDKIYVHKIEGRTFLGVKGQEAEIDDYPPGGSSNHGILRNVRV